MVDEFYIPLPPPADMGLVAYTQAWAHVATAAAPKRPLKYLHRGMDSDDYQNWFRLVGKPFLFPEELREAQRGMWYCIDWAKV